MAERYEPKDISFLPPILRRKWIAPDNPRELGTLVLLVGLAVIFVSLWSFSLDTFDRIGKRSTIGKYVGEAPFRSGSTARVVGVYLFEDEAKVPSGVRGDRVFYDKKKIPKKARIIWPNGRPQMARVVNQYLDYLFAFPMGLAIFGLGIWIRRKRVDPFDAAMSVTPDGES